MHPFINIHTCYVYILHMCVYMYVYISVMLSHTFVVTAVYWHLDIFFCFASFLPC